MAYVIAEPCINVEDRACVEVCSVDSIHPRKDEDKGKRLLYIHLDECIDCGVPASRSARSRRSPRRTRYLHSGRPILR